MSSTEPGRTDERQARSAPAGRQAFARRIDCAEVQRGDRRREEPARGSGFREAEAWEARRRDHA